MNNYGKHDIALHTLESQSGKRLATFENRHSLETVVSMINGLHSGYVNSAISFYQKIIRNNVWFFPDLCENDLESFLVRWGEVHKGYSELADEIFSLLANGEPINALATSALLTRVIQSETMRGWVGKRSPSGLDVMLNTRVAQLEDLLTPLDDDGVDDVFSYGGIFIGNPKRITAEKEIVNLFTIYRDEVGRELTIEMLNEPNKAAQFILRNFCRYSLNEFNIKYQTLCGRIQKNTQADMLAEEAHDIVMRRLSSISEDNRALIYTLLDEVKVLNYLNLNLEVKYSFKGFAGFMHFLVFDACKEATGIDTDVYEMRNALINKEGKKS